MKKQISSAVSHDFFCSGIVHLILALLTFLRRWDQAYLIRSEITQPQDGQLERMMKNMANRRDFFLRACESAGLRLIF